MIQVEAIQKFISHLLKDLFNKILINSNLIILVDGEKIFKEKMTKKVLGLMLDKEYFQLLLDSNMS